MDFFSKRYVRIVAILLFVVLLAGCGLKKTEGGATQNIATQGKNLSVEVLDIGQGDAILIRTAGQNVLVDSGDIPMKEKLVAYLKKAGIKTIDKVIITHPHADHLGGMAAVFDNFEVKAVYDSGQTTTTATYKKYLATIKKKSIPFNVVSPGEQVDLGDVVSLKFLAPQKPLFSGGKDDLNNNSIVAKLVYGNFSMLLTGDAEQEAEARILKEYGGELKSTVLKSGHHGSNTASSEPFLQAVSPEVVVISVGENNDYHHPHPSTIKKYQNAKLKIYRTDQNGTVTITSNGQGYTINKEK
ncbi:MAG: MBL fold metallo-hydrolase [Pelosinus sp.]|nr:MBL fold metallo-hydrolase [Pelosinus sp.]